MSVARSATLLAALLLAASCHTLPLKGRSCPCAEAEGYRCCAMTNQCYRPGVEECPASPVEIPGEPEAVATYAADNLRTGWYPNEAALAPASISSGAFGVVFAQLLDGSPVYAQPLVVRSLLVGGIPKDVLVVATGGNTLYGLDAATGKSFWSLGPDTDQLGPPWNPQDLCNPQDPAYQKCLRELGARLFGGRLDGTQAGIVGTPVVDQNRVVYLVAKRYTDQTGTTAFYLHGVDITTGREIAGFPVLIAGDANGLAFDPHRHMQRSALLLSRGTLYVAFGSVTDTAPGQGWIFAVSLTAKAITGVWVDTDGSTLAGGGIWQSGGGLVSDQPGRLFFTTGNAAPSAPSPGPLPGTQPPRLLGGSLVQLTAQPEGALRATQFFSPANQADLSRDDCDLGSAGPIALPPLYFGGGSTKLLHGGKQGILYLHEAGELGGLMQGAARGDRALATLDAGAPVFAHGAVWPGDGGHVFLPTSTAPAGHCGAASPAVIGGLSSYGIASDASGAWSVTPSVRAKQPMGYGTGAPIVTSDGTQSGSALVWTILSPDASDGYASELRAYDPLTLALRFRLPLPAPSAKWALPGVGASMLYVATADGRLFGVGGLGAPPESALPHVYRDDDTTRALAAFSGPAGLQLQEFTLDADGWTPASLGAVTGVTAMTPIGIKTVPQADVYASLPSALPDVCKPNRQIGSTRVYMDSSAHIHTLSQCDNSANVASTSWQAWVDTDISEQLAAPVALNPYPPHSFSVVQDPFGSNRINYVAATHHLIEIFNEPTKSTWFTFSQTQFTDGAQLVGEGVSVYFEPSNFEHIVYSGIDKNLYEFALTTKWEYLALTASAAGAVASASAPVGYADDKTAHVVYRGSDDQVHQLSLLNGTWSDQNLTLGSRWPALAAPYGYWCNGMARVVYPSTGGVLNELSSGDGWQSSLLPTSAPGYSGPAGQPIQGFCEGATPHLVFMLNSEMNGPTPFEDVFVGGTWITRPL